MDDVIYRAFKMRKGLPMKMHAGHLNLYAADEDPEWTRMMLGVEAIIPPERIRVYSSMVDLALNLRKVPRCSCPVVLLPGTESELDQLVAAKAYLSDRPILLILPDAAPRVVAKAHLLRPRALLFRPVEPQAVAAALAKLAGRSEARLVPSRRTTSGFGTSTRGKERIVNGQDPGHRR